MAEPGPEAQAAKDRIELAWDNREQTGLTAEGLRDLIKDEIRALSVDLPAGKQYLLYAGFMEQAGALSARTGSFVGVIQDTHAGQLVDELYRMPAVIDAVDEIRFNRGLDTSKYGVKNFVQFDLGSPADLASARFAEKASGGAYMLSTNARADFDNPANASILHRTEMKIFLGQNVEIDGTVYSNQSVTSINGISRETLLEGGGERQLSNAEYGKAFNAVEAVSRTQVNFIAKAIGLGVDADGNISSSDPDDYDKLTEAFNA
ncbi:MAG: hypothetical protein WBC85_16620, partial [Planktotalea sp.]|uniref:hypothetical protein n=1 Tax=Planktotalea sp. TaxID=2029877 RepID=UPI003C73D8E5